MCLEKREMYIGWKFVDACLLVYIYRWRERDRYDIYIYILHTQRHLYVKKTYVYIYNTLYTDRANVALPGCMKTFGFRLTTD
jgi:hypothetical protein